MLIDVITDRIFRTIHCADPELMAVLWHGTRATYVVGVEDRR